MDKPEVYTSCNSCIFEEEQDCKLNKLPLFEANGAILDDENGHTIILGRQCNFKRTPEWLEKYKDNHIKQLETESNIKYGILINSNNVSSLISAIEYAEKQIIKPETYYIIYNNTNFERQLQNIHTILNLTNKRWFLKFPVDKPKNEFEFVNEYIITNTFYEPFLLYIRDSNLPRFDLIYQINKSINIDLKQVMLFSDFDYIFTPTILAKTFYIDRLHQEIIEAGHADKILQI